MQTSSIHWLNTSREYAVQSPQAHMSSARQCGSCTACCQGWLKASIFGHEMSPGQPCHYVGAEGCSIYDSRPVSPCRSFFCAWRMTPQLFPEDFRPDLAGFIVKASIWEEFKVFILVSAGRDPQTEHLNWMRKLCRSTGVSFFYEINGETSGYGPSNFVARLSEYQKKNKPLW